ncbi:cytochrome b5-like heme/steroid binding domain-containing protein [Dichotomopilus funicola]|uniref:Cytochrome b5-like heme/steroid binding domain-containing protein n=1 Tax=Dichotomopilus funicola TaxID=1934379 RepID=A0AAN6UZG4_9PEZI|nr:cytochrome b5-like heme/steroid binding domain-containing protein [Dichotomopilus funicola]
MAEEASARRRKPEPVESQDASSPEKPKQKSTKQKVKDSESYSSHVLDAFRVLTFLVLAYIGLSYLVSSGDTYSWGFPTAPRYLKTDWWLKQLRGPLYLTPSELATYNGSDPSKPLYLAINGTIYDVSSNARTYGPGGSYQYFSGVDAARAYVTGCFAEDRTPDMRGVEEMYLPIDDPVVDRHWTAAELAELKKEERAKAEKKVHDNLSHWVNFFKNSPKYDFVGYVKRPEGWPESEPVRQLCDQAAKGRKKRVVPKEKQ